jgi:hypothetical protein
VPSLFNLVAFAIALSYPISGTIHGEIRSAIGLRQRGEPVANPLEPSQVLA